MERTVSLIVVIVLRGLCVTELQASVNLDVIQGGVVASAH